jgi:ribonuclease P protein subunit RPR2
MPSLKEKRIVKQIAKERIEILMEQALKTMDEDPKLAQRYVELARRIGMKYRVRIPKKWKMFICRGCKKLMIPGVTCRIRIQRRREPHVTLTCLMCGHVKRYLIKRKH